MQHTAPLLNLAHECEADHEILHMVQAFEEAYETYRSCRSDRAATVINLAYLFDRYVPLAASFEQRRNCVLREAVRDMVDELVLTELAVAEQAPELSVDDAVKPFQRFDIMLVAMRKCAIVARA